MRSELTFQAFSVALAMIHLDMQVNCGPTPEPLRPPGESIASKGEVASTVQLAIHLRGLSPLISVTGETPDSTA